MVVAVSGDAHAGRSGIRVDAMGLEFRHFLHRHARLLQPRHVRRHDLQIESKAMSAVSVHTSRYTIETIQWTPEGVVMIDQTRLPRETVYVTCTSYGEVADAIRTMVIRGAPAIGVAAAMGVAIGALHSDNLAADMPLICETLAKTRP